MVEPVSLQMVRDLVAIFGVIAGFTYYIMTARNAQRTQQMALDTRKTQIFLQMYGTITPELIKRVVDIRNWKWTDYDDFHEKYNPINNPEAFALWNTFGRTINGIAELRRKNLMDIEFLDEEMIVDIKRWWTMFGALEKEGWERGHPGWGGHFPFIKEVIDYDRRRRSWLYDEETCKAKSTPLQQLSGRIWVQPEEIEQMRMKLYK